MVCDLNMDIEVIGLPTVREPDGLAMSSRNVFLSSAERASALGLSRSLVRAERLYEGGERDAAEIIRAVCDVIAGHPGAAIDYVQICDPATMQDIPRIDGEAVLALAVRVGKTRLIDNHLFGEPLEI
jgi:pantoate--beta-alanine ligase